MQQEGVTNGPPLLIEPVLGRSAPAGLRWYVVRDRNRVLSGRATAVALGSSVSAAFLPNELIFETNTLWKLASRMPKHAGEDSYILLPESYRLPEEVASARAEPVPENAPAMPKIRFRREETPPDAPSGYDAYTFLIPTCVYAGIATVINGDERYIHIGGPGLEVRRTTDRSEASHILVPRTVAIPPEYLDEEDQPG